MAKKSNTIKSQLDALDRERADAAYAAQVKQEQAALAQEQIAAQQPVVPASSKSVAQLAQELYGGGVVKPDVSAYGGGFVERGVQETLPGVSPAFDGAYNAAVQRQDAAYAAKVKERQRQMSQQPATQAQAAAPVQPAQPAQQAQPVQAAPDTIPDNLMFYDTPQGPPREIPGGGGQAVPESEVPSPQSPVGRAVIERAVREGLFTDRTGAVGEDAERRALEQGLFPGPGVTGQVGEGVAARAADDLRAQQWAEAQAQAQAQQGIGEQSPKDKPAQGEGEMWYDNTPLAPRYMTDRMNETRGEMNDLVELDEELRRREDARKRIAALGDAFASFANLVGTAHGAENQKQTYATPLVRDSVEERRKLRVGRMQQIRKNLDEQWDAILLYQMNNDPEYLPNKMAQQRIDNAAANRDLQYYKADMTAANQAANRELNRDRLEWQKATDERDYNFGVRKQEATEADRAVGRSIQWANYALSKRRLDEGNGRGSSSSSSSSAGGGGGGWSKSAGANYNAMKTEIAQGAGYNTWEEFVAKERGSVAYRNLIRDIDGAKTPNAQQGMMNSYAAQYAPNFWDTYYIKEEKQNSNIRQSEDLPTLYDIPEEEEKDKKKKEHLGSW